MSTINAWAAPSAAAPLEPFSYDAGPLPDDAVEIAVEACGLCHSDLSMLDNEWGRSVYPLVPGHEVVGRISALGRNARGLREGQRVGLGWLSGSCLHCSPCTHGDHHLCATVEETIVGRHGGFAEAVRAHWRWVTPLPEALDAASAGPLFCGGITVFSPLVELGIRPTDRVGVVGIGGLGHLAVQFARAWGCEVTAFTSSAAKAEEAKALGAHHVVTSTDESALKQLTGAFDLLLVTVNVTLPWHRYIAALAPRGRLHFVGAVLEPVAFRAFSLIGGQRSISGSPTGSPASIATMLDFCARHGIAPRTEHYPITDVNQAVDRLRHGSPHYRVVVDVAARA
ncbi:MAG: NADPH-dependent aldehyde reductase Ahr [Algiphilus sp.]